MPRSIVLLSILAGLIFFFDLYWWHRSILFAGAGMATILANTQVFFAAVLGIAVFREKLRFSFIVVSFSAIIGISLLIGVGSDIVFDKLYISGIVFGLLTGVVYAGYLIVIKVVGKRQDRPDYLTLMAWTSLFTACFLGLTALMESEPIIPPDMRSIAILLGLALVAQSLGWWVIASSLPKATSSRSSLMLLLQPVLATVWGVVFFGEYLTLIQIIGASITLTAIYFGSIRHKH